jgi:hypothetical protein
VEERRHRRRHRQVRNFSAPVYSTPLFFVSAGGKLVYSDGTNLWRSNGTRGGTVQVLRLRDPLEPTFFPPYFGGPAAAVVGDRVFFSASVPGGDPRARELRVASLTTPDAPSDLIVVDQPPEAAAAAASVAAQAAGGVRVAWRDNSTNESGFVVERSRTSDFALPDATLLPARQLHLVGRRHRRRRRRLLLPRPRRQRRRRLARHQPGNQVGGGGGPLRVLQPQRIRRETAPWQMPPTTPPSPSTSTRTSGARPPPPTSAASPATPAASTAS